RAASSARWPRLTRTSFKWKSPTASRSRSCARRSPRCAGRARSPRRRRQRPPHDGLRIIHAHQAICSGASRAAMLHFQRWKVILILGIVIAGFLFALPNVFSAATVARLPTWLPHKQVNLGLDLQGGAHLLYQLDEKEMIEDWLGNIRGDVRETLRKDRIGYSDLGQNLDNRS